MAVQKQKTDLTARERNLLRKLHRRNPAGSPDMPELSPKERAALRKLESQANRRVRDTVEAQRSISQDQLSGGRAAPGSGRALAAARRGDYGSVYGPDGSNFNRLSPNERRQIRSEHQQRQQEQARRGLRPPAARPPAMGRDEAGRRLATMRRKGETDEAFIARMQEAGLQPDAIDDALTNEGQSRVMGPDTDPLPDDPEARKAEVARRRAEAGLMDRDLIRDKRAIQDDLRRRRSQFLREEGKSNPAIRRRIQELDNARIEIENSDRYSDSEREQLRGQIDQRIAALSEAAGFTEDDPEAGREPSLGEQFEKEVYRDPSDGTPYVRDQHGSWRVMPGWKPNEGSRPAASHRDWIRENPSQFFSRFYNPLLRELRDSVESFDREEMPDEEWIWDEAERRAAEFYKRFMQGGTDQQAVPGSDNPWSESQDQLSEESSQDGIDGTSWKNGYLTPKHPHYASYVTDVAGRLGADFDGGSPVVAYNPETGQTAWLKSGKLVDEFGNPVR